MTAPTVRDLQSELAEALRASSAERRSDADRIRDVLSDAVRKLRSAVHDLTQESLKQAGAFSEMNAALIGEGEGGRALHDTAASAIDTIESMGGAIRDNAAQLGQLQAEFQTVVETVTEVLQLVRDIDRIARHSRMVAMNASIEAAHAGEHGRGFVMVAEEVRSLAEESQKLASRMDQQLDETRGGLNGTLARLEGVVNAARATSQRPEVVQAQETIGEVADMTRTVMEHLHVAEQVRVDLDSGLREATLGLQFEDIAHQVLLHLLTVEEARDVLVERLLEHLPAGALEADGAAIRSALEDFALTRGGSAVEQENLDAGSVELF